MAQLAASRYAKALFDLALETQEMQNFSQGAQLVLSVCEQNQDIRILLTNPQLSSADKMALLTELFKNKVPDVFFGFFDVLCRKNRESELVFILDAFLNLVRAHQNIVKAKIVSALPLSDTQLQEITDTLSKRLQKQIEVETEIDASLLGGVAIHVDGRLIDGSLRTQFENMKKYLLAPSLAQ